MSLMTETSLRILLCEMSVHEMRPGSMMVLVVLLSFCSMYNSPDDVATRRVHLRALVQMRVSRLMRIVLVVT